MSWQPPPDARAYRLPPIRPEVVRRSARYISPIARHWFRYEARGLERIPPGQTILVTHHDGGILPLDGVCFGQAWYRHFDFGRPLYVLTHDILHKLGRRFATLLADSGVIPADRGAMDAALAAGASVLVFPGAARETFRPFTRRREIDLGGRAGFVAQAIRWGVPITPVVSAGAHETVFVLAGGHGIARALGLRKLVRSADALPILAGLPWGLWVLPFLPQLPLPAKITTQVLEPIDLSQVLGRRLSARDADDPATVAAGFDLVLSRMRVAINQLYDERRFPVLG